MNEDPITKSPCGIDSRLARIESVEQEMHNKMTHLTWAVNLWGGTITILLGITLAMIRR